MRGSSMKILLNETLKIKGKSQYWLSQNTGIAASTINNLCNGKTTSIQFSVIDKICEALQCDITDILCSDSSYEKRILLYNSKLKKGESE